MEEDLMDYEEMNERLDLLRHDPESAVPVILVGLVRSLVTKMERMEERVRTLEGVQVSTKQSSLGGTDKPLTA